MIFSRLNKSKQIICKNIRRVESPRLAYYRSRADAAFWDAQWKKSFSKKYFLTQLQKFIPSLSEDDIRPGISGVRAQALGPNGELVDDFRIQREENMIHVLNAPSPAATASLAIGEAIDKIATEHFNL